MITAGAVAIELRRIADALDKEPESVIRPMILSSYHWGASDKETFLKLVNLMPRPLQKKYGTGEPGDNDMRVTYEGDAVNFYASIPRSIMCELVEPAKPAVYRCSPLLSEAEDEAIA